MQRIGLEVRAIRPILVIIGVAALALGPILGFVASPASAEYWIQTSQSDFLTGTLQSLVVTPEGSLNLDRNGMALTRSGIVIANGPAGSYDSQWARDPTVLLDNTTYRMWYRGSDGARWRILYATSSDGVSWTKHGVALDNFSTMGAPFVMKENSTYHMWFQTGPNDGGEIYHATSLDAIGWLVDGVSLYPGTSGAWDSSTVGTPWVVRTPTRLLLYYLGSDGTSEAIGVAGSTNYTGFSALSNRPILDVGPSAWDAAKVRFPAVVPGTPWTMYYAGLDGGVWREGRADSPDGLSWTKETGNPVLSGGPYPAWDYVGTVGGAPLSDTSGVRFYYTGTDASNNQIGLAVPGPAYSVMGTYESRVFDSGRSRTTWLSISTTGSYPPGTAVSSALRSGDRPSLDGTWSSWQIADPSTRTVSVPRSRYVQYRLVLSRLDPTETPTVTDVAVAYDPNHSPNAVGLSPSTDTRLEEMPVLTWSVNDDENDPQIQFELQLSRDASFSTVASTSGVVTSPISRWEPPSLDGGVWFWRVRVFDGEAWGPWASGMFNLDQFASPDFALKATLLVALSVSLGSVGAAVLVFVASRRAKPDTSPPSARVSAER